MTRRKVVFAHDIDPDFSWLDQDCYNPSSKDHDPIYPSKEDADAKRNAYDGDWYRDPDNHVALSMLVYEMTEDADDWQVVDSLGSIDFLANGDDWTTGTFYRLRDLARFPYLHELAKDAGLPE